jgi:hypothetical protein
MTPYEKLSLGLNALQGLVLIVVLIVYARQLTTMREQLATAREGSAGQNLLALANFLQTEDVRDARRAVIETLETRSYTTWTPDERRVAAKVCSSYTVAAIVLEMGLVPPAPIVDNWGPSIRRCHRILQPFIQDLQKPEESGPTYWGAFDRLNALVVERDR